MTTVIRAHVHFENVLKPNDPYISSSAVLRVDGFGDVDIKDCISMELGEMIKKEVEFALRVKLGQVVKCSTEENKSDPGENVTIEDNHV